VAGATIGLIYGRVDVKTNDITSRILGSAIHIHTHLGPGLLESAYEACLCWDLARIGLSVERQKTLPVNFNGRILDAGYRLDLLVEGQVIVELKAIEAIGRIHVAQMMTYLRFSGCKVGLIINFNVTYLKDGIRRVVMGLEE
jgi:GxxExxY protein